MSTLLGSILSFKFLASFVYAITELPSSPVAALGLYDSNCMSSIGCDPGRNLTCDLQLKRCICAQHPLQPLSIYIYDVDLGSCVPILAVEKEHFWTCEERRAGIANDSTADNDNESGLGFCKSHHECQVIHNSSLVQCNLEACSCECVREEPQSGTTIQLRHGRCQAIKEIGAQCTDNNECGLNTHCASKSRGAPSICQCDELCEKSPNDSTNCDLRPIPCQESPSCSSVLGHHSYCNQTVASCLCAPPTEYFRSKCTRKVRVGESCEGDSECEFGAGEGSVCVDSSCSCKPGHEHNLEQCTPLTVFLLSHSNSIERRNCSHTTASNGWRESEECLEGKGIERLGSPQGMETSGKELMALVIMGVLFSVVIVADLARRAYRCWRKRSRKGRRLSSSTADASPTRRCRTRKEQSTKGEEREMMKLSCTGEGSGGVKAEV